MPPRHQTPRTDRLHATFADSQSRATLSRSLGVRRLQQPHPWHDHSSTKPRATNRDRPAAPSRRRFAFSCLSAVLETILRSSWRGGVGRGSNSHAQIHNLLLCQLSDQRARNAPLRCHVRNTPPERLQSRRRRAAGRQRYSQFIPSLQINSSISRMSLSTSIMIHHPIRYSQFAIRRLAFNSPLRTRNSRSQRAHLLRQAPSRRLAAGRSPHPKSEKSSEGLRLRSSSPRKLGEFELLWRVGPAHERHVRVERFRAGRPHQVYRTEIAGDRP